MEIMTQDRQEVVDDLVERQEVVAREQAAADRAAEDARTSASDAEVQLVELDRMRAEQQDLAESMDERLDDALAEAAALAAIDQAASEALVAEEVALRGEGPRPRLPPMAVEMSVWSENRPRPPRRLRPPPVGRRHADHRPPTTCPRPRARRPHARRAGPSRCRRPA